MGSSISPEQVHNTNIPIETLFLFFSCFVSVNSVRFLCIPTRSGELQGIPVTLCSRELAILDY